jgi:DNA-binding NtrC family response regulator
VNAGTSVLVVDPDAGSLDVVRRALPGSDVHRVDSVYEALAHVAGHRVDVLVAERLLPGASADDLLQRLEHAGYHVPVILCSHRRTPMEHQHPDVVATFIKPVDVGALRLELFAATATAANA